MRFSKLLVVTLTVVSLAGCDTLSTKQRGAWGKPYSGTECAFYGLGTMNLEVPVVWILGVPIQLVDGGLSFVMDTVLLPVDLSKHGGEVWCRRGGFISGDMANGGAPIYEQTRLQGSR